MTLGSPYNLSLSLYSSSRFENHKSRIKFLTKPYDNFNSYPLLETGEVGRRIIGEEVKKGEQRVTSRMSRHPPAYKTFCSMAGI